MDSEYHSVINSLNHITLLIRAISHILKNENYELCFLAGSFVDQITTRKNKRYSHLAVGWNVWGFHQLGLFWRVPWSNYDRKKGTVIWPLVAMSDCFSGFVTMFFGGFFDQITNYDQKKGTVLWLVYTICNTRNILFLLCLYLKPGKILNVGKYGLKVKHPHEHLKHASPWWSRLMAQVAWPWVISQSPQGTLFARGCLRAGCKVFLLTLWSGRETIFFSKYINLQ